MRLTHKIARFVAIGLGVAGCCRATDVTDAPALERLRSTQYELVKDLFVYRAKDFPVPLVIIAPGCSSAMPVTVESYLESPDGWMYGQAYKERWGEWHGEPWDIIGVLPKGTRLEIARVNRKKGRILGLYLSVLVTVEAEPFRDCVLYGGRLFLGGTGGRWDLRPIPNYLCEVRKEESSAENRGGAE